ncbi:MAG: propanediol utilization protein [Lewinellaceae bacterium]|nr:propanediol utilization protein [Lewinellaceae bacterium]
MKFLLSTLTLFTLVAYASAQSWTLVSENSSVATYDFKPQKFKIYSISDEEIKTILWASPNEKNIDVRNSTNIIQIPTADGVLHDFKIVEYDMMEPELKSKFPDIRTFYGVSPENGLTRVRIDYGNQGFRAVINDIGQKTFIDYANRSQNNERIVYFTKDYIKSDPWECSVQGESNARGESGLRIGDCQLRSYRLALATTGEYSTYHGGTPTSVMSAVTTSINRVNEVYEAEFAVRLILVANTDQIFYYNSSTDPYTNNNGSTMLGQNITTCNNVIGSANYDIGHVFSTGGGGVAYLGSVCGSNKAGGVTGQPNPIGDNFDIDYVAHEMGHQFGGNHTQYNNCNRNNATAMEPGSASSIMGYAGICSPNVQAHSDATFHAKNMEETKTFISTGNGNSCDQIITTFTNTAPTVTSQPNYSIPKSTPFALTLTATDPEGDDIIYAWDQMNGYSNPAQTMPPASTNTSGPVFRNIMPTVSPTRYFPDMATILTGSTSNTWEVVPSIGRTMSFRGVARDFTGVAGCNSEINLTVTTVAAAGPFIITSQGSPVTWTSGSSQTITWNVASTTASPISCANVTILFSADGGATWPTTLAASVPNNGSASITAPNIATTQGRVMVKAVGNVFLDVNNANITINAVSPSFTISATPNNFSACMGTSHNSTISITPENGFSSNVQLSISGLPTGANASFSKTQINPSQTSILNIDYGTAVSGNYSLTVTGASGSLSFNTSIAITILPNATSPALNTPTNNATNVAPKPTLSWTPTSTSTMYDLEVAYDMNFQNIIIQTQQTGTSYNFQDSLLPDMSYFWRVKATNTCSTSDWSTVFTFKIEACWLYETTDLPKAMNNGHIVSSLHLPDRGLMMDLNLLDLSGLQNETKTMSVSMTSPTSTNLALWNNICDKEISVGYDINFDDEATPGSWPCPPEDGLTYQPSNSLSVFDGAEVHGLWSIDITTPESTAMLNTWKMHVCLTNPCRLTVDHTMSSGTGSLFAAINCAVDGDTIRISPSLSNDTIYFVGAPMTINKELTIIAEPSQNLYIKYTGSDHPTLWINGALNKQVSIKGLNFLPSNSTTISTLNNDGSLKLENVNLYKSTSPSTVNLSNGASFDVISNVKIMD